MYGALTYQRMIWSAKKICTYHDSWAVVLCANLWADWIMKIIYATKMICQDFTHEFLNPLCNGPQVSINVSDMLHNQNTATCKHGGETIKPSPTGQVPNISLTLIMTQCNSIILQATKGRHSWKSACIAQLHFGVTLGEFIFWASPV